MSETPQSGYASTYGSPASDSYTSTGYGDTTETSAPASTSSVQTVDSTDESGRKKSSRGTSRRGTKPAARGGAGSDVRARRAAAKKAIASYESLVAMDADDLSLVKSLLGMSADDVADVAVELVVGTSVSTSSASKLVELADAGQMEALVEATMLAESDEATFKSLFGLANSLGLDVPARPTGPAVKSAMSLVQGLADLDSTSRDRIQRVVSLLS